MRLNGVLAKLVPIHPPSTDGIPPIDGTIIYDSALLSLEERYTRGTHSPTLTDITAEISLFQPGFFSRWQTTGGGLLSATVTANGMLSRGHCGDRLLRNLIKGSAKTKDVLVRVVMHMHKWRKGCVLVGFAVVGGKLDLGNGVGGEHAADVAPVGMRAAMRAGPRVVSLSVRG